MTRSPVARSASPTSRPRRPPPRACPTAVAAPSAAPRNAATSAAAQITWQTTAEDDRDGAATPGDVARAGPSSPTIATAPRNDGDGRNRQRLEEVAGPVGRDRLGDDPGADERPEAAADQRRDRRDARRLVEMRVDRAADQVEPPAPADSRPARAREDLGLVASAPGARVQPEQRRRRRAAATDAARSSAAAARDERRLDPGWPSAIGSGPSVTRDVSIVSTPSRVDLDREPVHRAVGRPVLRASRLDPHAVVARLVARAVEPEVLDARVRPAAQVRADLRQGPDVERGAVAGRVAARGPAAARRVDRHDEARGSAT